MNKNVTIREDVLHFGRLTMSITDANNSDSVFIWKLIFFQWPKYRNVIWLVLRPIKELYNKCCWFSHFSAATTKKLVRNFFSKYEWAYSKSQSITWNSWSLLAKPILSNIEDIHDFFVISFQAFVGSSVYGWTSISIISKVSNIYPFQLRFFFTLYPNINVGNYL